MNTAEEILNKYDTSRKYIDQTCRPELFAAMQEIAELAFKAGYKYSERFFDEETQKISPNEEKFIQQLFPQSK